MNDLLARCGDDRLGFRDQAPGWRRWWSSGDTDRLRAMAARLPAGLIERDRRLLSCARAAEPR